MTDGVYEKALDSGFFFKTKTFTQLTAPGLTSAVDVEGISEHGIAIKVAAVDTNVIVETLGSFDGTNFFAIPLGVPVAAVAATGLTAAAGRATITVNGTYVLHYSLPLKNIKCSFVSEAGGTSATVDFVYRGKTS